MILFLQPHSVTKKHPSQLDRYLNESNTYLNIIDTRSNKNRKIYSYFYTTDFNESHINQPIHISVIEDSLDGNIETEFTIDSLLPDLHNKQNIVTI